MSYQYDQYLMQHKACVTASSKWLQKCFPEITEIPYRYIVEMICNWWSFSWSSEDLTEIFKWYEEHKNHMILHPSTRVIVEDILKKFKNELQENNDEAAKETHALSEKDSI